MQDAKKKKKQVIPADKPLSHKQKRQIADAVKKAKMQGKIAMSAQQTICYKAMYPDGVCRVTDKLYTKTMQFFDINYQLARNEDKNEIFENYCDFLNYFDHSISVQLSFLNQNVDMDEYQKMIDKDVEFDVSEEIDALVLENMPQEFYNEKGKATKEYLNENIGTIEKNLEENLVRAFGKPYLTILKLYDVLTSICLRVAMILICIVTIIVSVRTEKANALGIFQTSSIVTMTVTLLAFIIIKLLSNVIDQRLAGGWLSRINLNLMILFIVLEGVISLALFLIRKTRNIVMDNI